MAGDWIKMRGNLWDDPRVARLCDLTNQTEAPVIGALYWLWATADQHTEDGVMPGLTLRQIDRKTGVAGFGQAACDVGWLADHPEGVHILKFEEHNGASAKKRIQTAKRVAAFKAGNASEPQDKREGNASSVTDSLAERDLEKEKSREEENKTTEAIASAAAKPPRGTRKCPASFVLSAELLAFAADKHPAVNCTAETDKFRDYTYRNVITDWSGAWRNWIRRADESAAVRHGPLTFKERDAANAAARVSEFTGGHAVAKATTTRQNDVLQEVFDAAPRRLG